MLIAFERITSNDISFYFVPKDKVISVWIIFHNSSAHQ